MLTHFLRCSATPLLLPCSALWWLAHCGWWATSLVAIPNPHSPSNFDPNLLRSQCALVVGALWLVGDQGVRKRILKLLHQKGRTLASLRSVLLELRANIGDEGKRMFVLWLLAGCLLLRGVWQRAALRLGAAGPAGELRAHGMLGCLVVPRCAGDLSA